MSAILWGSAPLGGLDLGQFSFASGPLSTIPIASTATPANIAGCAAAVPATCAAGETLGQAAAADDILPTATLADIGASGFTGHGTLADLIAAVPTGSTLTPLLGDLRLDLAGPTAPAVTIEAFIDALTGVPDPVLGDLRLDLAGGDPTLGDLRLDLVAGAPGTTVNDLLALLSPSAPDVLLGDLRIDLIPSFPALTIAQFVATLSSTTADGVLLGDLRLDRANGVDALVLDALSGFLLDPAAFAPYLLGALGTYTDITGHDITLGELGIWTDSTGADITLGQLAQYLDDSVSLSDVLLGLVPPTQFPYQDFPIASLGLNKAGRDVVRPGCGGNCITQASLEPATLTYMEVQLRNSSNSDPQPDPSLPVDVEVVIPAGADFAHVETGSRFATTVVTTGYDVSHLPDGRTRILVHVPPFNTIGSGANDVKVFWANALQLGPASATYRELDPNGTVVDAGGSIPFNVQDGAEPNTPVEEIALAGNYSDNGRVPVLPVNANGCSSSSPSCTGLDPTYLDDLMPGFISVPGDVDWYELPGVRAGSRISVDLTNLPLDADLVLYGPAGTSTPPTLFPTSQVPLPGQLVEDPGLGVGQAATSIASQALSELRLDNGYSYPDDSLQGPMTPLSISQHSGTDPESVGVIAPVSGDTTALVSGNYVVAVSGHNGATSNLPYLLRARVTTPTDEATCPARTFPNSPMPAIPSAPIIPADANTVFLTNQSRLVATYGQAAADDVAQSLTDLVTYLDGHPGLGIVPVVVPVDAYPGVRPAYDAWDDAPCSVSAANAVAAQITGVLRDIQTTAHGLAYVTIVGGDDIVPMGRVPDLTRVSNESEYTSTFGDTLNPVSAAEAASDTLTDDVYGDTSPTSIGNGNDLFVPRLSVGRLVESPADIEGQLGSFVSNQGTLDTHTGLVAGYDFLADGADAVASRLAVGGRTVDSHLIDAPDPTTPWTQADLLASLFPAGATPLVDSINAHYDHTALLPSAGNTGTNAQLETAADIASRSSAGQLAGRVLFTMGCHAGLAVPDAYVAGSDAASATLRGDWSQTLSAAGVSVYVANTGYGIGDTSSVAYSERLMGLFSKLLDGSLTAGQALTYAKQAYYGSLGAVGVYDTKILQEAAFYGLPFWRISPSGTPTAPTTPTAPSLPGALTTDPSTGLHALPVTENLTFDPVTDSRGTYWTANGPNGVEDPQVTHYQPIEPRTTLSVVTDGQTAHGALVTSLTSHDEPDVNPVLDTPTADLSASAPEVRSDLSAWPGHLATITTSVAPYGRAQSLVLVPGRFLGSTSDGTGKQRLFDSVGVSVLYAPDDVTDFTPPTIDSTTATALDSTITFTVQASDVEGPVKRVVVAYHDFDGIWKFTDLVQQGTTTTWTQTAIASHAFGPSDGVEYFVQVVDAAGQVGTASDKATGYTVRIDQTPPIISASVSPAPNAAGWSAGSSATVSFTCADAGSGLAADACPAPVTVTTQGATTVNGTVTDVAGNSASTFAFVQLDGNAPTISADITPAPDADGWGSGASATVTFTCGDVGSGLAQNACPASQTITAEGVTPVNGSVTDIAGNTSTVTATVRLDRTAPTISATIAPTPNAAGWGHPASATVSFSCSDTGSGIASDACPASQTISDEGVTSVSGTVADLAGNQASITTVVRIDRTAPVVTVLVSDPPHTAACSTTDALSGVAVQATLTTTTARVNGIPTTTAVCAGASDLAGNSGSATATFVAPMTFSGFIDPVNGPPVVNTGKAGRTYPIKFQLRDAQGAFISALPAVTSSTYQSVTCSTFGNATADPLPTDTSGSSGLKYDATTNQYTYTWKTPAATGCYVFRLGLADGATYTANFKLQ
ncbi:MAG TPA: PxKF domain-containing protein [Candidatus Limnocylindrales bacterium]|nr:PxKF domain-containing protein [Candidatus Limnocylindrales bacterium]